jgi:hypothetical protein
MIYFIIVGLVCYIIGFLSGFNIKDSEKQDINKEFKD